jgi:hypothetical protein
VTNKELGDQRVLRYQEQRGLDAVPAYGTGLQLLLGGGQRVYLALSATELVFYFGSDLAIHYDLEARLVKMAKPNEYWRRSLSHRGLFSRKRTRDEGGGLERVVLASDEADALVSEAHKQVKPVDDELRSGTAAIEFGKPSPQEALDQIAPLLARVAQFDVKTAQREAERFRVVYGRVAVLPPDEYNALVLQATEGCGYGGCLFCELYRGVRFRVKTPAEFEQHIRDAAAFHGASLRSRRSIFLGEANALTLAQPTLVEMLHVVNEHFEFPPLEERKIAASWWLGSERRFAGIASFMDVFTGTPRSSLDFIDLQRLGLRRVYIGIESGDDALLKWLRKPASAEAVIRYVRNLKEADIAVGVIVLIGAGGQRFAAAHGRETARVLNELPLGRGDYIYFSPLLIYPSGPYSAQAFTQNIEPLSPAQMDGQENAIRAALRFDPARGRPYLARYELETFIY